MVKSIWRKGPRRGTEDVVNLLAATVSSNGARFAHRTDLSDRDTTLGRVSVLKLYVQP